MATEVIQQRPAKPCAQGRDELNLIDFPIATLQHQQPVGADGKPLDELVCEIRSYDPELERVVPRKLTRRTSSKFGFPTPLEDEVLIGLLSITRFHNGFTSPRAEFRNGELFDLMGWQHNGESCKRLSMALDRLSGLKLKYENSWTTEDGTFRKEFSTGILESYQLTRQTRGRRRPDRDKSWIQWSSEVFSDIQRGNVKELDTGQFYSLNRPISQRMYRFLDRHLATSPHYEVDLVTLAAHLGLSELQNVGKIKQRLAPAIAELEALGGFIEGCAPAERYYKRGPGHWLIHFDRPQPSTPQQTPETGRANQSGTRQLQLLETSDAESLVVEFYKLWHRKEKHRVTANELQQASEIIERYGSDHSQRLLPVVVRQMKRGFPDARAFGATMHFWPEAEKHLKRTETQQAWQKNAEATERSHAAQTAADRHRQKQLLERWHSQAPQLQQEIIESVRNSASPSVSKLAETKGFDDPLVQLQCLNELTRRLDTDDAD